MITINSKRWVRFTAVLGTLFFSTLVFAVPPIVVTLEVDAGTLQVDTNTSQCTGGDLDCIDVAIGTAPFIKFLLPDACGPDTGDPQYELTGMRITQIQKVWPTVSNPLNDMIAKDFKADPTTGQIAFHAGKNKKAKDKLKFKNRNSHGYTVFYEITASPCSDSSNDPDIHLDPEIRNKGKN